MWPLRTASVRVGTRRKSRQWLLPGCPGVRATWSALSYRRCSSWRRTWGARPVGWRASWTSGRSPTGWTTGGWSGTRPVEGKKKKMISIWSTWLNWLTSLTCLGCLGGLTCLACLTCRTSFTYLASLIYLTCLNRLFSFSLSNILLCMSS